MAETEMAPSTLRFLVPTMEGTEVRYSLVEKQLAVPCAALWAMEAITGAAPVTVRTTYLVAAWVWDWMAKPPSGTAQMPTLAKWWAYLQQRSTLSTSPLQAQLQEVLGPVSYADEKSTAPAPMEELEASLFHEGQAPIPSDAWYTDGPSRGQRAMLTAVAIHPETDNLV